MDPTSTQVSLVIATFNRVTPLTKLLGWLESQTLDRKLWEVVIAVDGSQDRTEEFLREFCQRAPYPVTWFFQENAGAASARHNAIVRAKGKRIVIIDDDMEPVANFLKSHLEYAASDPLKSIVIGRICVAPNWETKPLHDVVGEYQRSLLHEQYAAQHAEMTPDGFATGNVSFNRDFYFEVGGFDTSFRIDEDRELGVRFRKAGAHFRFGDLASTIHHSDVGSFDGWVSRWQRYGLTSVRVWNKHNQMKSLHPLRHFIHGNILNRTMANIFLRGNRFVDPAVKFLQKMGAILRLTGRISLATAPYRAIISLKYHQGVRDALGGWGQFKTSAENFNKSEL